MVNMTEKEEEIFINAFCSAGIHVMFDTTYYCDLGCPHCHYDCTTKSRKIMPESDVYSILDELKKCKFQVSGVNFSGGEITTIEEVNPGYVKRILSKSIDCGFYTTLMTNGSFIEKPYAGSLINNLAELYVSSGDKFLIQMSFDQYHKNCITYAHKLIDALDMRLDNGKKYDLSLTGFKHNPEFAKNFTARPEHINVSNELIWDLNPIGRAKTNNLPNVRDTKSEFEEFCDGDKLKQLVFTPLYQVKPNSLLFNIIMTFNCNGNVVLSDAHDPENFDKFKTKYRKQDGTTKTLPEISSDLAVILAHHFYDESK